MKEKTQNERLAVVEVTITNLDKKMTDIQSDVKEIKGAVVNIPVNDFEKRITKLEKQSNLWRWLSPTLGVLFGSILMFLILEYLKKL